MLLHVQYVVVARDDDDGGVLTTLLWLNNYTHHDACPATSSF